MSDISITAASVIASANAVTTRVTAGATITAGQPVYLDATAGKYKPADANVLAASVVKGIALNGAADGQPLVIALEDADFTLGGTVAVGDVLIASATAGGIAPVADAATGMYVTVLGTATTTTKMALKLVPAGAVKA